MKNAGSAPLLAKTPQHDTQPAVPQPPPGRPALRPEQGGIWTLATGVVCLVCGVGPPSGRQSGVEAPGGFVRFHKMPDRRPFSISVGLSCGGVSCCLLTDLCQHHTHTHTRTHTHTHAHTPTLIPTQTKRKIYPSPWVPTQHLQMRSPSQVWNWPKYRLGPFFGPAR
jgi:hypothetical protein